MSTFTPPDDCAVPKSGAPRVKLIVKLADSEVSEHELSQKAYYTIGDKDQDIHLPVGRAVGCVAQIYHRAGGQTYIVDLDTTTGIYLNTKSSARQKCPYLLEASGKVVCCFGHPKGEGTVKFKLLDAAAPKAVEPAQTRPQERTDLSNGVECALKRPLQEQPTEVEKKIVSKELVAARNPYNGVKDQLENLFREHQDSSSTSASSKSQANDADAKAEPAPKRQRTDVSERHVSTSTQQTPRQAASEPTMQGCAPQPGRGSNGRGLENPKLLAAAQRPPSVSAAPIAAKSGLYGALPATKPASSGSTVSRAAVVYGPAVPAAEKSRQDSRPVLGPAAPARSSHDRGSERQRSTAEMQQRTVSNGRPQASVGASAAVPAKSNGKCDKCDGPHKTELCPNFKKARDNHKDAWANYGKEHPGRMGGDGGNFVLRGAQVIRMPGDGSCLFHSLGYGLKVLGERDVSAGSLRSDLARFIQRNSKLEIAGDTLEEWVSWDSNASVNQYVQRMAAGRAWGGGIEIAACAAARRANIHVYERKGGEIRRISCFEPPAPTKRLVHILYQGGTHYDALQIGNGHHR